MVSLALGIISKNVHHGLFCSCPPLPQSLKLKHICPAGFSCRWRTTAQPFTSWFCLAATMRPSSWRSSTDRWRSTPTSSVSCCENNHLPHTLHGPASWTPCSRLLMNTDQVPRRRRRTSRASRFTSRERGNTCRPAASSRNVASTAEYQAQSSLLFHAHASSITLLHFFFLLTTFLGFKSFSQVFQHWRQQGSGLGHRDSESLKVYISHFHLLVLFSHSDHSSRWVRPRTILWPINW